MESSITVATVVFILSLASVSGFTTYDASLNLTTAFNPLNFVLANNYGNSNKMPPHYGLNFMGTETFIRQGSEASESMFPYIASIQVLWSDNRLYHICGASIFETNKVVTAAHCMVYWGTFDHFVALGVKYISRGGEALIRVENTTVHPSFRLNATDFPWNVAVLTLESHVVLSSKIQLATLANKSAPAFDMLDDCEIMGWGATTGSSLPDALHFAILKGISNNDCRKFLRIFKYRGLQQNHKCAWNWPHASCQGDSGGPLVCQGLVVGISSWGVQGCNGCFPSVYTRVSYFYNWITAQ